VLPVMQRRQQMLYEPLVMMLLGWQRGRRQRLLLLLLGWQRGRRLLCERRRLLCERLLLLLLCLQRRRQWLLLQQNRLHYQKDY
jgi:hypothetical protein